MNKTLVMLRSLTIILTSALGILILGEQIAVAPGGIVYDYLLTLRKPLPAPQGLVLVDSSKAENKDNTLEADQLALALLVLAEAEPRCTMIQVPIGMDTEGTAATRPHLEERFDKEFQRITGNIKTLFEGIRLGSIRPQDASRYVGELTAMVEAAQGRLLLAVVDQGDMGARLLEQSSAVLGAVLSSVDLQGSALIQGNIQTTKSHKENTEQGTLPRLSFSRFDGDTDGVIRRIYPIRRNPGLILEHLAYQAMIYAFDDPVPNLTEKNIVLLEYPRNNDGSYPFLTIELSQLLNYREAEQKLYYDLKEMERSLYFSFIDYLDYPTTLYEYASSLEAELLLKPAPEQVKTWRNSRMRCYEAITAFLLGPSESLIISGYEDLIHIENLDTEERTRIQGLIDLASQAFAWARLSYEELISLRSKLLEQLSSALVIIGPLVPEEQYLRGKTGDVEASVALMASVASDTPLRNVERSFGLRCLILPALALGLILSFIRPLHSLLLGALGAVLCALVAAFLFIHTGLWINPLLFIYSIAFIVLVSAMTAYIYDFIRTHSIRRTFRARVIPKVLSKRIRVLRGSPLKPMVAQAAILAVRSSDISQLVDKNKLVQDALRVHRFRETTAAFFRDRGAAVLWADSDLVFLAFGSPLDVAGDQLPMEIATLAYHAAEDYLKKTWDVEGKEEKKALNKKLSLGIGVDLGACVFDHTSPGAYAAYGGPAVHARIFSSLTHRYGVDMVIGQSMLDNCQAPLRAQRLDILEEKNTGEEYPFYGIRVQARGKREF